MENPNQEQDQLEPREAADGQADNGGEVDAAALFAQIAEDPKAGSESDDKQEPTPQEQAGKEQSNDAQEQPAGEGQAADDDPWASVPAALKSQFEHLQNDHRANAGRVSALTKKSMSLEQENARLKAQLESGKGGQPQGEQPTAEQLSDMSDDEIEREFPEIAKLINGRLKSALAEINQQLTPVQQMVEAQREQEQQAFYQSEIQVLTQAHPDWQQVNADPRFQQWVQTQTPATQALYGSELAGDNINLLNLYKSTTGQGLAPAKPKPPSRQSNLADHAELERKGSGRAAGELTTDPVDLFNKITS